MDGQFIITNSTFFEHLLDYSRLRGCLPDIASGLDVIIGERVRIRDLFVDGFQKSHQAAHGANGNCRNDRHEKEHAGVVLHAVSHVRKNEHIRFVQKD